jgi:hypothetical protein
MRVLTLSTYPIAAPRHGGQQRLHHIVRAFKAAGHQTQSIGIFGSQSYPAEEGFLSLPPVDQLTRYIKNPVLMEDWAIGQMAVDDAKVFSELCDHIDVVPDVIHVEQPWLFAFAQRYARQCGRDKVKLIYGSANIEHELKRSIVEQIIGTKAAKSCAELVLKCECSAARGADLVAATSSRDAQWLRPYSNGDVLVAANGVAERPSTIAGIEAANAITSHRKFALYCASSHPPNIAGFFDLFGRGIGFLSPIERIVVAGGAGLSIRSDSRFKTTPGLAAHFIDAGEVSEECLQGLLETSHVMVLPLTQGGGTNLKTAEALWAGHWVVATQTAMRGFEDYSAERGLDVCSDASSFREAIRVAMQSAPLRLSSAEKMARRPLLWEYTLKPMVSRAGAIAKGIL